MNVGLWWMLFTTCYSHCLKWRLDRCWLIGGWWHKVAKPRSRWFCFFEDSLICAEISPQFGISCVRQCVWAMSYTVEQHCWEEQHTCPNIAAALYLIPNLQPWGWQSVLQTSHLFTVLHQCSAHVMTPVHAAAPLVPWPYLNFVEGRTALVPCHPASPMKWFGLYTWQNF